MLKNKISEKNIWLKNKELELNKQTCNKNNALHWI
jgi:hypothetical protein